MIRSHNIDWDDIVQTAETASFNISKYEAGEIIPLNPAGAAADITITLDSATDNSRRPGPIRFIITSATTTYQVVIAHNSLCYTFSADLTLGSALEDLTGLVFELTTDGTKWAYGEGATSLAIPTVTTLDTAGSTYDMSDLDPGLYLVDNSAGAVIVDLDAAGPSVGVREFIIRSATTGGTNVFKVRDTGNLGLASAGTTYTYGAKGIEEKGLKITVIGTAAGYSISDSPEPNDAIGPTLIANTNISTLSPDIIYLLDATGGTFDIDLDAATGTPGRYYFLPIATTDHATDFPVIDVGALCYNATVDIDIGGTGVELVGQLQTLVLDGAKFAYSGSNRQAQVHLFNDMVVTGNWAHQGDGSIFLDQNFTNDIATIKLGPLKVGDEILKVRVLGGLGATGGKTTTLAYDLRKVTKASGGVTDASIDSGTTGAIAADQGLDEELDISGTPETVAADFMYYVHLDGTTANDAACDLFVIGAEVKLNEK